MYTSNSEPEAVESAMSVYMDTNGDKAIVSITTSSTDYHPWCPRIENLITTLASLFDTKMKIAKVDNTVKYTLTKQKKPPNIQIYKKFSPAPSEAPQPQDDNYIYQLIRDTFTCGFSMLSPDGSQILNFSSLNTLAPKLVVTTAIHRNPNISLEDLLRILIERTYVWKVEKREDINNWTIKY
eukprot:TRINITY_DN6795_c0_g1_i2.p1 TRINITY_DN6795_c0_g1~~TRINITY_DN6795_c0_g1_i2.p1  ORF type:complete len:191 (-),score=0.78 TRINITY_DN6795_c0_g1_i2:8-553(-)